MTYLWTAVAFLVFSAVGWYIARHNSPATGVARLLLPSAAVVTLLVTQGLAQQVAAAGFVGLLLGVFAAEVTKRRRTAQEPRTD